MSGTKSSITVLLARARAGEGPTLIEAKTLRIRGHFEGDKQAYREDLVEGLDVPRDPLKILREQGVPAADADRLDEEARAEAEAALAEVLAMPAGDEQTVVEGVWV